MNIVPRESLLHFMALLPEPAEPRRYFAALRARRPQAVVEGQGWKALATPRPCAFGPVEEQGWAWQLVLDLGPVPEPSWRPGFGDVPPPAHRSHAMVFLTAAPPKTTGLERVRRSLELARAWVDAGATALVFPSAGIVETAESFSRQAPESLDADRAAALLVSFAMMGKGADRRTWLRTRGMSQFGLPDLCCALPAVAQPSTEDLEAAQVMFSSLAPYLMAMDRGLKVGETVQIGARNWRAASEAALRPAPPYFGTLLMMERIAAAAG